MYDQVGGLGSACAANVNRLKRPSASCGSLREREGDPVGLGLHMARDHVLQRQREGREHDEREQAERNRLGVPHPAAPPGDPRDEERAGDREERVPGDALEDVLARVVAELVRDHDLLLVER